MDKKPIKITAPYNFVPLNKHVFYPDWAEQVTQDLPFSDAEDGVIEVKLKNASPLFTRDGSNSELSAHIMRTDGTRQYFIPATTIKGMLREIVEIMSFGKMQEDKDYQNRTFGYRYVANKAKDKDNGTGKKKSEEYRNKVGKGKPGWLAKIGEKYYFTPCDGKLEKITFKELKKHYPTHNPNGSIWKSNVAIAADSDGDPVYPQIKENDIDYQIVCTGDIKRKEHEMLFPADRNERIELSKDTINAFKTMYESTPGFAEEKDGKGCFLMALEKGKEIPVFYLKLHDERVTLGLSRMFKLPYKYNVRQQVEFLQKAEKNCHDLGELLFGYTSKEDNLKGRIQVSHAFMEGTIDDSDLIHEKGILGTPKASYYPLYIKQQHNPFKTYDDEAGIAGRKLYRIHTGGTTTRLPQGENKNVGTEFYAIPSGQTFTLRISLHNTKEAEIGAILSALTLNMTSRAFLNIGMAKSFGYGKCAIAKDDIQLRGLSHDVEYYMHCFEEMMSEFTYLNYQQMWAQTESITQMVNILSEHDDSEVKMMELEEYQTDNSFETLQEKGYFINSLLTTEDKEIVRNNVAKAKEESAKKTIRKKYADDYQKAEDFVSKREYKEAIKVYNHIIDELFKYGIIGDVEQQRIKEIEKLIEDSSTTNKLPINEPQTTNLKEILDKPAGNGEDYSVKEFKVCFQKVEKWLKDAERQKLNEDEISALYETSKRLLENPIKKDAKVLNEPFEQCGIWKNLTKYLGEDKAKELYDKRNK